MNVDTVNEEKESTDRAMNGGAAKTPMMKRHSMDWNGTEIVVFDEDQNKDLEDCSPSADGGDVEQRNPRLASSTHHHFQHHFEWRRSGPPTDVAPGMDKIQSWSFDVLPYSDVALVSVIQQIFDHYDLMRKFNIDKQVMNDFIWEVCKRHDVLNYHNWHHAVCTMHGSFLFLSLAGGEEMYDDKDIFAILVAALCHDLEHSGQNNDFHVKTQSELALKYENQSVLENHSITQTLTMLQDPKFNIFVNITDCDMIYIEHFVREMILATDPAHSATLTISLATRVEDTVNKGLKADNLEDRLLLGRMILHASDVKNTVHEDFSVAKDWCSRVTSEFTDQATKEKALGVSVTPYMDGLETEYKIANMQIEFCHFMIVPFFKMVGAVLPKAAHLNAHCLRNIEGYKKIMDSCIHERPALNGDF